MPGDEIQFPAAAVARHAASVDGIADAVRQARSAVQEVTMDSQAYGQLCQFLPTLLTPLFELAVDALDDADDALRDTAQGLRAVAASTTATDEAAGRRVRTAGALPELPL
ncbi:type VII secretion target [Actinoplanes sp. NPDC051346]|uniref:type VII secretion target n=1 Tax=Actinoplanes sp. NPDC051346 TaxID=3155048 RepID=UPI0034469296